jgi:DNA protecting protein DprA
MSMPSITDSTTAPSAPKPGWTPGLVQSLLTGGLTNAQTKRVIALLTPTEYAQASDSTISSLGVARAELSEISFGPDITARVFATPAYPRALAEISSAPVLLFIRGSYTELALGIAVVGTRQITSIGRSTVPPTIRAAGELGVPVYSGLALGVDALAHTLALDAGLTTVAVLSTHPSHPTPAPNVALAERILENGGSVISEQLPSVMSPLARNLMARNRIIAALSSVTIPAEASLRSGTMGAIGATLSAHRALVVPVPKTSLWDTPGAQALLALTGHRPLGAQDLHISKACYSELLEAGFFANAAPTSGPELVEMIKLAHWFSPLLTSAT